MRDVHAYFCARHFSKFEKIQNSILDHDPTKEKQKQTANLLTHDDNRWTKLATNWNPRTDPNTQRTKEDDKADRQNHEQTASPTSQRNTLQ